MANDSSGKILTEYTIIAGVNGAGKSTLFNAGYLVFPKESVRINSDELIRNKYNNQWQDVNIQIAAGKQTVKLIRECLSGKKSFNQETTLSGRNIIRTTLKAKEQGYYISLHYVGLESPDLAVQRVQERMKKGGHGVAKDIIKNRFDKSLNNLVEILPFCDEVNIYDNSKKIDGILSVKSKELLYIKETIPPYLKNIIDEYIKTVTIYK